MAITSRKTRCSPVYCSPTVCSTGMTSRPKPPAQMVLSSCDVGRTDDRPGGEPLGLVAALLRSGVATVVAGTSRVSDEVAAAVMAAYHQRLSTGERPAIAL